MATKEFKELDPQYSAAGLRFGIAMSRFNEDIGAGLLSGATDELAKLGADPDQVVLVTVPGALELPLTLQAMAASGRFDALIALGCVIRGETYHFEIVSNESARGIIDVQLHTGVPVANAVLTTENDDQALVRMEQKGREAAQCAVEMVHLLRAFKS